MEGQGGLVLFWVLVLEFLCVLGFFLVGVCCWVLVWFGFFRGWSLFVYSLFHLVMCVRSFQQQSVLDNNKS